MVETDVPEGRQGRRDVWQRIIVAISTLGEPATGARH
jgi:hypothetical protein